jgi:Protein of unknown function (DUF2569)
MKSPTGIGGWLALLCVLLLVWQPLSTGYIASATLDAVTMRGLPAVFVLLLRLVVVAVGIAAGLSLLAGRPFAVALTKTSLILSAVTDVFVYSTSYFPSNRMPGDAPYYVAGSLAYYGVWLMYLVRSRRVHNTFVRQDDEA